MNRPDFIIIGAMKSATSTLRNQLMAQPGIFATEPKEPNFFSDDEMFALGEGWYSGLYDSAGNLDTVGEASTHYTKLPRYPDTVKRAHAYAPDAKLIYVMRHPVDRLISHYIHNWSMGFVGRDVALETALQEYDNFVAYSQYSVQLKPWIEAFGKSNVLPVFFDRLVQHSESELRRICSFIGYSGEPKWVGGHDFGNVSSQRLRRFPLYSLFVESKSTRWARALIPKRAKELVKSRLRMANRPELTGPTRATLEHTFDQDLKVIGEWLGVELTCENFKSVTSSQSLDWTVR
jgi:hypothetical protein